MVSKLGLARAELPKLEGKEGFIARTRTPDETPISPAYVASPQYKFDPFETEAQKSVKIERASDEALAAFGVTRTKDGLQFPFKKSSVEISDVYNTLGNKELSEKILDSKLRSETVNSLKDELSGIYRKNH